MGSVFSNTAKWLNSGFKDRVTHDSVADKRGYFIKLFANREVNAHNSSLLQTIGCRNTVCWLMTTLGILAIGMVMLVGMRDDRPDTFPPTTPPFTHVPTSDPTSQPTSVPTSVPTDVPTSEPTYTACEEKDCTTQTDCENHPTCDDDQYWPICYPNEDAVSPYQGKCMNTAPYQKVGDPACLSPGDHDTPDFNIESNALSDSFENRRTAICFTDSDCMDRTNRLNPSNQASFRRLDAAETTNDACSCPEGEAKKCKQKNITKLDVDGVVVKKSKLGFCACEFTNAPTPSPTVYPTNHPTVEEEDFFDLLLSGTVQSCPDKEAYDFVHLIPGRYEKKTHPSYSQIYYYKHTLSFANAEATAYLNDDQYTKPHNTSAKSIIIFQGPITVDDGVVAFQGDFWCIYMSTGDVLDDLSCSPTISTSSGLLAKTIQSCYPFREEYERPDGQTSHPGYCGSGNWIFPITCEENDPVPGVHITVQTARATDTPTSSPTEPYYCKWEGAETDYPNIALNLRPNSENLETNISGSVLCSSGLCRGSVKHFSSSDWCQNDMYLDPTVVKITFVCDPDRVEPGYFAINTGDNNEKELQISDGTVHAELQCGSLNCDLSEYLNDKDTLENLYLQSVDEGDDYGRFPLGSYLTLRCRPGYWNSYDSSNLKLTCAGRSETELTTPKWHEDNVCSPQNDCTIDETMWQEFHGFGSEFVMAKTITSVGDPIPVYECPQDFQFVNPDRDTCSCHKNYLGEATIDPSCGKCEWKHCKLRDFKNVEHGGIAWSTSITSPVHTVDNGEHWFNHQKCDESKSNGKENVNHGVQCKATCDGVDEWLVAELQNTTSDLTDVSTYSVETFGDCRKKCDNAFDCEVAEFSSTKSQCNLSTSAALIENWSYDENVRSYIVTKAPVEIPCFRGEEVELECKQQCEFSDTRDNYGDPFLILNTSQVNVNGEPTGTIPFEVNAVWKPGLIYEDTDTSPSRSGIAVCPLFHGNNVPLFHIVSYSGKESFKLDTDYINWMYSIGNHFTAYDYYNATTIFESVALPQTLVRRTQGAWERWGSVASEFPYGLHCSDGTFIQNKNWPSTGNSGLPRCMPSTCFYGLGVLSDPYQELVSDYQSNFANDGDNQELKCPPNKWISHLGQQCNHGNWTSTLDGLAPVCKPLTSCSAGQYITRNHTFELDRQCANCELSKFSNEDNAAGCTYFSYCNIYGTTPTEYIISAGSTTRDYECGTLTNCPAGQYVATAREWYSNRECETCAAGKYSSTQNAPECEVCSDVGSYCPTGSSESATCPDDHYCPTSSEKHVHGVSCIAGKKLKNQLNYKITEYECEPCDLGKFTEDATHLAEACTYCTNCSSSTRRRLGHQTVTACTLQNDTKCNECAAGKYAVDDDPCSSCLAGTFSSAHKNECTPCPKGKFSGTENSASCTSCEEGKYNPDTGEQTCTDCGAGGYCPKVDLYDGWYAKLSGFEWLGPKYCANIPTYGCNSDWIWYFGPGITASEACSECGGGEDRAPFTYKVLCPGGTYSTAFDAVTENTCTDCDGGSSSDPGSASCTQCPAGKYTNSDKTDCITCESGRHSTTVGATSVDTCVLCPLGKVEYGRTDCISCGKGSVPNAARAECLPCEAGEGVSIDSQSEHTCEACTKGKYSTGVWTSGYFGQYGICKQCPLGKVDFGRTDCISCGVGSVPNVHQNKCLTCEAGEGVSIDSQSEHTCEACTNGKYSTGDWTSGYFGQYGICKPCTDCNLDEYEFPLCTTTSDSVCNDKKIAGDVADNLNECATDLEYGVSAGSDVQYVNVGWGILTSDNLVWAPVWSTPYIGIRTYNGAADNGGTEAERLYRCAKSCLEGQLTAPDMAHSAPWSFRGAAFGFSMYMVNNTSWGRCYCNHLQFSELDVAAYPIQHPSYKNYVFTGRDKNSEEWDVDNNARCVHKAGATCNDNNQCHTGYQCVNKFGLTTGDRRCRSKITLIAGGGGLDLSSSSQLIYDSRWCDSDNTNQDKTYYNDDIANTCHIKYEQMPGEVCSTNSSCQSTTVNAPCPDACFCANNISEYGNNCNTTTNRCKGAATPNNHYDGGDPKCCISGVSSSFFGTCGGGF